MVQLISHVWLLQCRSPSMAAEEVVAVTGLKLAHFVSMTTEAASLVAANRNTLLCIPTSLH